MKVHFQKITKGIAVVMSAVLLSLSVFTTTTITAYAKEVSDEDLTHLLDLTLAKTGVSANYTMLSKLQQNILNIINGTAGTYVEWCEANGYDGEDRETWAKYLNSDAYYMEDSKIADNWRKIFQSFYFLDWLFQEKAARFNWETFKFEPTTSLDTYEYLTATTALEYGTTYTIRDADVEAIRATYDELADDELGYYYIKTLSPANVVPSWFRDGVSYNNFKNYVKSSENATYAHFYTASSKVYDEFSYSMLYVGDNTKTFYLVASDIASTKTKDLFDENWTKTTMGCAKFDSTSVMNITDKESFLANVAIESIPFTSLYPAIMGYYPSHSTNWTGIFTKDGRKMIVFKTAQDLKNYLGGYREAYTSVTYDYSTDNDNSVTVGGDYLINNGGYSHDTITENIDSSSEDITESIIDSVVDNSITEITNNYYTDSDSSGGSGSSGNNNSNSGSSIWDGLTTLVGGIGDFLNFFVTLIGEVLSLLSNLLTQIMDLVGQFAGVGGDFVYFMADFFVFVPKEIWEVILLGVTTIIGLALLHVFKK